MLIFYTKLPTSRITSHQKVAILCHLCCRFTRSLSSSPPTQKKGWNLKQVVFQRLKWLSSKTIGSWFQDHRILISRKTGHIAWITKRKLQQQKWASRRHVTPSNKLKWLQKPWKLSEKPFLLRRLIFMGYVALQEVTYPTKIHQTGKQENHRLKSAGNGRGYGTVPTRIHSLKLTWPLKIGRPERRFHLPSIDFQGRTVSFGEGSFTQPFKISWWFQPISKILVKLDHFPKDRGKNKK